MSDNLKQTHVSVLEDGDLPSEFVETLNEIRSHNNYAATIVDMTNSFGAWSLLYVFYLEDPNSFLSHYYIKIGFSIDEIKNMPKQDKKGLAKRLLLDCKTALKFE